MAKRPPTDAEIAKLTYEQALEQLESLLERVESGDIALEAALDHCETGSKLIAHCRGKLDRVEQRVQALKVQGDTLVETDGDAADDD